MNDKIVELISDIDSSSFDQFKDSVSINTSLDLDTKNLSYDYSWLNQIEQYLPFVSNIVSMDFSHADISVITSYENRLIKTLLCRLADFISFEQKKYQRYLKSTKEKSFNTKLNSFLEGEEIEIDIKVKTRKLEDNKMGESYGMSLSDRIERVLTITNNLLASPFIDALKDASLVHSPINKTPLFEEEVNYRKALELFNYIDSFNDTMEESDNKNNRLLITSYLEYQQLNNLLKKPKDENVYRAFLERLIEKMVIDSSMDEKSFKKLITKKFEDEYTKKKNREKNIQNIFFKNIDNYNKQVKDALRALKN